MSGQPSYTARDMKRFATIDVGTNSVLLLVAERAAPRRFTAVVERAAITRLGRGVDATKRLSDDGVAETLAAIERFAKEAEALGAGGLVISATSAARDATNGAQFLEAVRAKAGVLPVILSGDEEARLSYESARADFGSGTDALVVLDIGGGSTEFIFGSGDVVSFRRSFDVGAVRLTERHVRGDPPTDTSLAELRGALERTFAELPPPPPRFRFVGVAGTVTTVCAIARRVEPYDAAKVHGAVLTRADVAAVFKQLAALPLEERRAVPGLQPKRADVIVAGAAILEAAMDATGATEVLVSDRGLRWGLLVDRFGGA